MVGNWEVDFWFACHPPRKSRKLADLTDALPLQILPPNLSVDHDLLVLEQHHDVRAAEEKEAELGALLQPGANLGRQVNRGNEAHPDRQHRHEPHLRRVDDDQSSFLVDLVRLTVDRVESAVRSPNHVPVHSAMDVAYFLDLTGDGHVETVVIVEVQEAVREDAVLERILVRAAVQ